MFKIIFRINKKKILFKSWNGVSYSCNPRAISEDLYKKDPSIEFVWAFKEPNKKKKIVPHYVKCVKANSLKNIYELVTSKVWIFNNESSVGKFKRKNQIYIQTWHGDRGLKKVLYDIKNNDSVKSPLSEEKYCDLMITGSKFGESKLRSAFHYDGEFLRNGCPRNDILIAQNAEYIKQIKQKLSIRPDTKIVMYAPTFRKKDKLMNKGFEIKDINLENVIEVLENKSGEDWVCLIRAHITVSGFLGEMQNHKILDVSEYEEMSHLLLITDLFITDYSSSCGDFILTKKPLILYHADIDEYTKNDRTFYFNVNDTPFWVANSQDALLTHIESMNEQSILENCKALIAFYGVYETGCAGVLAADYILDLFGN